MQNLSQYVLPLSFLFVAACGASEADPAGSLKQSGDQNGLGGSAVPAAPKPPPGAIEATSARGVFKAYFSWESGTPAPNQEEAARLVFTTATGAPATRVVIRDMTLVMACCGTVASKPQTSADTAAPPGQRTIGHIVAPRSGTWRLRINAAVDDQVADDIDFNLVIK